MRQLIAGLVTGAALATGALFGLGEADKPKPDVIVATPTPAVTAPEARCPSGYTESGGSDPDTSPPTPIRVCTSPDRKTILTLRDGRGVTGFREGRFLTPEEIAELYR